MCSQTNDRKEKTAVSGKELQDNLKTAGKKKVQQKTIRNGPHYKLSAPIAHTKLLY